MREEVEKFLFFGLEEDKASFFERAQAEGVIHFIDPHVSSSPEIPSDVQRLTSAIKVLRGLPVREQEENFEGLEADELVASILRLQEEREKWEEELRLLGLEISRIEVFGDFSLEDIRYIEKQGRCVLQFFCARPQWIEEEGEPEGFLFIASEHGLDYYLAIHDAPFSHDKMIEMKFERSLGELREQRAFASAAHRHIEEQLKGYVKYNRFLHHAIIDKLDRYHLHHAQTYVQQALGGSLFAVEGWVPANKISRLEAVIGTLAVHVDRIAVEPEDAVPTCLENQGLARLGEDLVHVYDTPSATDKDPSLWVLGGFTLFFAFIMGDAGYGLIYLALALFLRHKYPHLKGVGKRILNLFTVLCVGCVVWGSLMTSFFGMQIGLDNPLRRFSLLQWLAEQKAAYHLTHDDGALQGWIAKYPELASADTVQALVRFQSGEGGQHVILNQLTDNIMFELALFIGVVHLITSLLRYTGRHWQNAGWVFFLAGAYLYFPFYLGIPSLLNFVGGIDLKEGGIVGGELMAAGVAAAWLLSIFRNGWTGIFEITVLIQVFADTFSYLRLYALGLAGGIVASTINDIASGMSVVFAVLLVLLSHAINIGLSTMSGIIHGLRLNYLEWYHYSFEGGGKRFRPLKLLQKE